MGADASSAGAAAGGSDRSEPLSKVMAPRVVSRPSMAMPMAYQVPAGVIANGMTTMAATSITTQPYVSAAAPRLSATYRTVAAPMTYAMPPAPVAPVSVPYQSTSVIMQP